MYARERLMLPEGRILNLFAADFLFFALGTGRLLLF
jgi:hypothetical protein